MSILQKLLLIFSGIFYVLVILGFFLPTSWISFIFFILHSSTLLFFTYISQSEPVTSFSSEEQELTKQLSFVRQQLQVLSQECEKLAADNKQLRQQLGQKDENRLPPLPADAFLPPLLDNENQGETIDVVKIVEETMKELQVFADSVGLIMRISAAVDPLYLKASPSRMRILFRNIIDNSIKYMKRAGTLVITLSIVGDDIFVVLKDNGKGLPLRETPHIFELNYQGSNRISGNGLGLTQAKAIVESYGGTIYAKSTPELGMGIYIQIPLT